MHEKDIIEDSAAESVLLHLSKICVSDLRS